MNAEPAQLDDAAMLDDAALLEEVKAGRRSALERLIRRHNQKLYRIARAQLGSDHEAEDVTQFAWVQMLSLFHQWDGRGSFAAWAATIVVNACRQRHRVAGRVAEVPAEVEATLPTPDEETMRRQVREVLEREVDALPPLLRVVFVMRDVEELSGDEVAAALGVTEPVVRVRLHRARQALRQSLDARFSGVARALYPFLGDRCDRMTAWVLAAAADRAQ